MAIGGTGDWWGEHSYLGQFSLRVLTFGSSHRHLRRCRLTLGRVQGWCGAGRGVRNPFLPLPLELSDSPMAPSPCLNVPEVKEPLPKKRS